jgi:hypothetical protein
MKLLPLLPLCLVLSSNLQGALKAGAEASLGKDHVNHTLLAGCLC